MRKEITYVAIMEEEDGYLIDLFYDRESAIAAGAIATKKIDKNLRRKIPAMGRDNHRTELALVELLKWVFTQGQRNL